MPNILIVEPCDALRAVLERVVADVLGWECDTAATGLQAWKLLQRFQPDVILAEGYMRGLEGLGLAYWIQGHPCLAVIPVVLMMDMGEAEVEAAGVVATLRKPFSVEALVKTLTRVAEERKSLFSAPPRGCMERGSGEIESSPTPGRSRRAAQWDKSPHLEVVGNGTE
jgi:CheY-like chemotaxis protein